MRLILTVSYNTKLRDFLRSTQYGTTPIDKHFAQIKKVSTFSSTTLGSGTIEFPEFIAMMENKLKITDEDDIREAFCVFDRRGKGHIDAKEFHKVMVDLDEENLTTEEVEEIMERINSRGNGRIRYEGENINKSINEWLF